MFRILTRRPTAKPLTARPSRKPRLALIRLEGREVPAVLAGNVLTYTDIDGDAVRVTFTHATVSETNIQFAGDFHAGDATTPQWLEGINLGQQAGAGFTLTANPQGGRGDGHADVGWIRSSAGLGVVNVDGDVGIVDAETLTGPALVSLTVNSAGRCSTEAAKWHFVGPCGSVVVRGDIANAELRFDGFVKSINVGGSLLGTCRTGLAEITVIGNAGSIHVGGTVRGGNLIGGVGVSVDGDVGDLSIGGSLIGGAEESGTIDVNGYVKRLSIGGSVLGGTGYMTHQVAVSSNVDRLTIGGDLSGSDGSGGGSVAVFGDLGILKVGGSVRGGPASLTGSVVAAGSIGSAWIGHDVVGGDCPFGATIISSGTISAGWNFDQLTIGGDLIAGRVEAGGQASKDGMIGANRVLGRVTVGNIVGNSTNLAYITAGGNGAQLAIQSLTVRGSATFASILAGYNTGFNSENLDAGIGRVTIGRDLVASFVIAGSDAGPDGIPGNSDDLAVSRRATIGSVSVGGEFRGAPGGGATYYIYAPKVLRFQLGGLVYSESQLTSAKRFGALQDAVVVSVL
jgi:hypothetical protein